MVPLPLIRCALAVLVLCAGSASAQTVRLRLAGIAPEGASWTRELKAFGREVETGTEGRVAVKWYWGGIAGDELAVLERIRRNQLDGEAGAQFCDRLAPSLRVTRVLGLFQSHDESSYVLRRLGGVIDKEFRQSGFIGFAASMGNDTLFTREPVRTLAELKHARLWIWDLDEMLAVQLRRIGVPIVPLPIDDAARAYDARRTDGFIAIPTGALAFQWSAQSRWYTDLRLASLSGCLVIANRVFDALQVRDQQAVRAAIAKLTVRFEDLGRSQDGALMGGLFARQGTQPIQPSSTFRAEFLDAAHDARSAIPPSLVSSQLIGRVQGWLADFRAEHRQ